MDFYKILIGAVFFGLLVGLARAKFRLVPILASGLLILGYGISITAMGIWAAQCWDCIEYHDSRAVVFDLSLVVYGLIAGATLLSIWVGAGITMLLRRYHKAQAPR